ncbi:hypothetical protein C8R44DRAFT_973894 [Mycena epipterygia]|nr:hypothetical protein C8R44DRAFT_973894 [Mycena epipterygia]
MPPTKPRITFPSFPTPHTPLPRLAKRLGHLAVELCLTVCMSFAILFTLLCALGIADAAASPPAAAPATSAWYMTYADASVTGILRVTIVCTLIVYTAVEGGEALLRCMRGNRTPSDAHDDACAPYDRMHALEAGWREPFAVIRGYGSVDKKPPFSMAPGGSGSARNASGGTRNAYAMNFVSHDHFVIIIWVYGQRYRRVPHTIPLMHPAMYICTISMYTTPLETSAPIPPLPSQSLIIDVDINSGVPPCPWNWICPHFCAGSAFPSSDERSGTATPPVSCP